MQAVGLRMESCNSPRILCKTHAPPPCCVFLSARDRVHQLPATKSPMDQARGRQGTSSSSFRIVGRDRMLTDRFRLSRQEAWGYVGRSLH